MVIGGWWIYRLKGWSFENAVRFARLTLKALRFTLNALRFTLNAWRSVPLPLFCIHYCLLSLSSCLFPLFVPLCLCPFSVFTIASCLFPLYLCPIFINFATLNFTCWQQNHLFLNALGMPVIPNRR